MGLTPPITPEERRKMLDARKNHANASVLKNHKDPSQPIYSTADLAAIGWIPEAMVQDYRDFQLSRCPGKCGRYGIELKPGEISVDIKDPLLPPVWRINTQFMCLSENREKNRKTLEQLIAEEIRRLSKSPPPPPVPDGQMSFFDPPVVEDAPSLFSEPDDPTL
jgi:hypothetical protein